MKIAIAGYGVEGQASFAYWSKDPANELTIVDESVQPKFEVPAGVSTLFGEGVFGKLNGFDLVIRTASLAPSKIKTDGKVWSATNEFFTQCPAPIIGVTGTKGKGTTSSMIASILEAAGKKVWLVGNIGVASLEVLPEIAAGDIVVYELSSFQLWDIEQSPHIAVILPIEAEHLDIHADMDDYVSAKANIAKFQGVGDVCIFNPANEYAAAIGHSYTAAEHIEYDSRSPKSTYIDGDFFYHDEQIICSVSEVQLKGQHNRENACAALTVAVSLGISNDDIAAGLRNFKGLPHRLEFVRQVNGVDYYNDSFSSSPPATVAAAKAFDQPEILIIGGIDRGGNFVHLADELKKVSNIKEIALIGKIRQDLQRVFAQEGIDAKVTVLDATTMREIVGYAATAASTGDVVILSPGCASFDMFKDFYDRGDQFREQVYAL